MNCKFKSSTETALLIKQNESALNWHRKLGHLGKENMKKLLDMSSGIKLTKNNIDTVNSVCEICLKAKQTRTPFGNERTRAKRPLEIVHTDVCGPIDPLTWDKKRYMITFIDDFTNFVMVYLIERKSEVSDIVKEYTNQVETKWNLKILKLRCDNGKEFVNEDLKNRCRQRGTILDLTTPYTPQLNGKAKRMNRTLIEKTRALLTDAEIDKSFWKEAVRTAAYLTNRSPTSAVQGTPYKNWTSNRPDLSRLQIFDCTAYTKLLTPLKKLDDRCRKYVFVGYAPNGYQLYDKERKIIISRDVIFAKKEKEEIKNKLTKISINTKEENEGHEETENIEEEITETEESEDEIENLRNEEEKQEELGRKKRKKKTSTKLKDYVFLTYEEVTEGSDKQKWKKTAEEKKKSLKENNTWELVNKAEAKNKKILSNK